MRWSYVESLGPISFRNVQRIMQSTALNRSLDPMATGFEESPAYAALQSELDRNTTYAIKYGPEMAFHNHAAAMLTSLYRLGLPDHEIKAVLGGDSFEVKMLVPATDVPRAQGLEIHRGNWEEHLGGWGLYGIGVHLTFPSYREFFAAEVSAHGAAAALQTYLPRLAPGLVGDFFHAVIELGYHFESGNAPMLSVGLAWLAASYAAFPDVAEVPLRYQAPREAIAALARDDHCFPAFDVNDGSSGYIRAMEDLSEAHRDVVLQYELADLCNGSTTAEGRRLLLQEMCIAAVECFAAGGYNDFYLLHLVTGSRAVWAILNGADLGGGDVAAGVETAALRAFWRGFLYTYVARNRPWPAPPLPAAEGPVGRPWREIVEYGRQSRNSHIVKVIMNCADFWDRWQEPRFWQGAEGVVATREAGGKLVGIGAGSGVDRYANPQSKYTAE